MAGSGLNDCFETRGPRLLRHDTLMWAGSAADTHTDPCNVAAHTKNHEFRMTLFWLLCVSLVLGGLAHRRELRSALQDLWLHWFGVRVRVPHPARLPAPAAAPC